LFREFSFYRGMLSAQIHWRNKVEPYPAIEQLGPPKGAPNVFVILGIDHFFAESSKVLTSGDHQVRMEFVYAGGGMGNGATATSYVYGKKDGECKISATAAMIFPADDSCAVGVDTGSPVSLDYASRGNEFSGRVKGVQLAIADGCGGSALHGDGAAIGTRNHKFHTPAAGAASGKGA
jgi:hypothetical protein